MTVGQTDEIRDRGSDRGDQRPWIRPRRSETVDQTEEIRPWVREEMDQTEEISDVGQIEEPGWVNFR